MFSRSFRKKIGSTLGILATSSSVMLFSDINKVCAICGFTDSSLFMAILNEVKVTSNVAEFLEKLSQEEKENAKTFENLDLVTLSAMYKYAEINSDEKIQPNEKKRSEAEVLLSSIHTALVGNLQTKIREFFKSDFFKKNADKIIDSCYIDVNASNDDAFLKNVFSQIVSSEVKTGELPQNIKKYHNDGILDSNPIDLDALESLDFYALAQLYKFAEINCNDKTQPSAEKRRTAAELQENIRRALRNNWREFSKSDFFKRNQSKISNSCCLPNYIDESSSKKSNSSNYIRRLIGKNGREEICSGCSYPDVSKIKKMLSDPDNNAISVLSSSNYKEALCNEKGVYIKEKFKNSFEVMDFFYNFLLKEFMYMDKGEFQEIYNFAKTFKVAKELLEGNSPCYQCVKDSLFATIKYAKNLIEGKFLSPLQVVKVVELLGDKLDNDVVVLTEIFKLLEREQLLTEDVAKKVLCTMSENKEYLRTVAHLVLDGNSAFFFDTPHFAIKSLYSGMLLHEIEFVPRTSLLKSIGEIVGDKYFVFSEEDYNKLKKVPFEKRDESFFQILGPKDYFLCVSMMAYKNNK